MKRLYLTFLMLAFSIIVQAQHISVKDFYYAENDLTARTHGTSVEDQNGYLCALIKVETTEKGLWAFDVGMLGVTKTEMQNAEHPAEIWVYVPFSVLWITLQHEQLGKLNHYRFPCNIEKGCTYVMTLETTSSPVPPSPGIRQQYLAFQISPANAALEVNDRIWEVDADGNAQEFVNFGNYTYRVQAPNYHTEVGKVTVDDPDNTKFVKVTLNPNFGWIEVAGTGDLQGASVYIDNAMVGKAPCKSEALKSGQHNVRIAKKMYASYSETVTVNDNETTRLAPTLAADFAEVTLTVDADAEIWVNNEKKGTRTWTGPLGSGSYKIECKQANHETSLTTKEIAAVMNGQTITLPAPIPIYGSLMVESTPKFCKLYVDGKDMGTTPKSINEIMIGQHEIRLTQDGYADYVETVTITKGERKQVKATLSNGREIQFTCNVSDAQLEIDGQRMSSANGTYMLTYGQHNLRATATDYREYTYTIIVSETGSRSHSITMQSIMKDEETFTVNGVSFTIKFVEGGTFQMGATSEQGSDAYDSEKPFHSVTLSNYYMGETEVTQALWKAVMGSNPSYFKGDNLPVEQVSWNDCQEFIRKLNQKTGKQFRLPTEAEWEYAARGGKKSKGYKYAGSNNIGSVARYTDNSDSKTHLVKGKSPNELGLYDMSGNVWEWCQDWYGSYSSGSQTNPKGPSSGSYRVLRGGSWYDRARNCRVSLRNDIDPDLRSTALGFRLCCPQ